MRRSIASRLFSALAGVWLVIALIEPAGLTGCAMHGTAGQRAQGTGHGQRVSGIGQGAHSHHSANPSTAPADTAPDHHAKGCSCLGDCASANSAVAIATPTVVLVDFAPVASQTPGYAPDAPITHGSVVLPFANGPPARL
jgi:hypothetical protein